MPVAYVVFDVIYAGGELTLDQPLSQRAQILDRVFAGANRVAPRPVVNAQGNLLFEPEIEEEAAASGWVLRAPAMRADSAEQLEQYFEQAMARGNEGLMIKDLESPYMPGRRGRWWLKLKRELATLDVVVTAAEFGHGKRIHVLSDYTFAVRKGEELVNIGKAYSGLTDKEIAELTEWFLAHTIADHGHLREVEPNDRAGSRLQCHHALRSPRQRLRAALPADCARAARQAAQGHRHGGRQSSGFTSGSMEDEPSAIGTQPSAISQVRFLSRQGRHFFNPFTGVIPTERL